MQRGSREAQRTVTTPVPVAGRARGPRATAGRGPRAAGAACRPRGLQAARPALYADICRAVRELTGPEMAPGASGGEAPVAERED